VTELLATYRLQLGPGLDFARVLELVPYLRDLGVSHLYLSPSLQARSGSTHGYDVVDPTRISDELGGEEGLRALAASGLGIVLDIVPNHMGIGEENRWWSDPELRRRFFDVDPETGFYRRFFDIDDLAAVRQEDPEVFAVTHGRILELVEDGVLDGLRVDHPDGLADPAGYLRRLRDAGVDRVWVEKILHPGEALRDWPVAGTVGYEFLNDVAALFVDPAGESILSDLWATLADGRPFREVALEAQLEQARGTFSREIERLAREASDFTFEQLARALAGLPVYRTYVEPWSGRVKPADREAVAAAGMDERLARALLLEDDERPSPELVTRFQQTSPPITAKGVEDTAFYRYLRLLALNEVGGDPERFGLTVDEFHALNRERARRFPLGLLVTQTHDTKRSGDARARIGALAGMAAEWREHVLRWRAITEPLRRAGEGPDASEEYLVYQTLVGVWPVEPERLDAYVEKALRESKRNTNWIDQNTAWEGQVKRFGRALLDHRPFLEDFLPFLDRVVAEGERSALGQLLLKLTCPGVPDTFQGDELWRLSLVDPDNRRPVDWDDRRAALDRLRAGHTPADAELKMFVIWKALELRRRRSRAFGGEYTPVLCDPGVCAFLRGDAEVLVVVPVRDITDADLELPSAAAGGWRDALCGGELTLSGRCRLADLGSGIRGLRLLERAERGS
jgi:(1->4)-alpha-D-glucan 1-alpha-D-glucosylmutase